MLLLDVFDEDDDTTSFSHGELEFVERLGTAALLHERHAGRRRETRTRRHPCRIPGRQERRRSRTAELERRRQRRILDEQARTQARATQQATSRMLADLEKEATSRLLEALEGRMNEATSRLLQAGEDAAGGLRRGTNRRRG